MPTRPPTDAQVEALLALFSAPFVILVLAIIGAAILACSIIERNNRS